MKHHPDIESEHSSKAEFTRICEAYDVLSNGRWIYAGSLQPSDIGLANR